MSSYASEADRDFPHMNQHVNTQQELAPTIMLAHVNDLEYERNIPAENTIIGYWFSPKVVASNWDILIPGAGGSDCSSGLNNIFLVRR